MDLLTAPVAHRFVYGGVVLLHQEFSDYHLEDISTGFRSLSPRAILAAVGLTVCNYSVMIGYDWLGLATPQILANRSTLVSGGVVRLLRRSS